jgi:hypothetical protein
MDNPADEPPAWTLTLAAGPTWAARREEAFSPRFYHAAQVGGAAEIAVDRPTWGGRASLDLAYGAGRSGPAWSFTTPDASFTTAAAPFTRVALRVGAVRPIRAAHVGLDAAADVQTSVYNFGRGGQFTYFGTLGLDARAELRRDLGKADLHLQASAPIAAWVARSPYGVNDDRYIAAVADGAGLGAVFRLLGRGSLTTWDARQAVATRARLAWDRPGLAPFLALDLAWQRHVSPAGEALASHHAGLTVGALLTPRGT